MNEKFFKLSQERQNQIINGALKVFSKSSYDQASTIEIAKEAGISKGLLFHYFKNKKELYLFLYKHCVNTIFDEMNESRDTEETDFFELILQSQKLKSKLMKKYRYIYEFVINTYIEKEEQIVIEIAELSKPFIKHNAKEFFDRIDTKKFREGVDIPLLFQSLQWCAEGFMRNALSNNKEIDEIESEFAKILVLYRQNFYKEEYVCTSMNTEIKKIIP